MVTKENVHGFGASHLPISDNYDQLAAGRSIASHYDRLVKNKATSPFNEYFDDTILDLMKTVNISEGATIIDMGCGNGKTLERIKKEFKPAPGRLMGFDSSSEMVSIATKNFPSIEFTVEDMRHVLPNEENIADIIISINAVHYIPSLDGLNMVYKNAYRLLKPGGHYFLATGDHASTSGIRKMSDDQLRQWIEDGRKPMDWSMPDENGNPVFRLKFYPYLNEEHRNALVLNGFNPVEMYRNYPPGENILKINPRVYDILKNSSYFVFYKARKEK